MTWNDISPFVTDTIRRADTWQQIRENIDHLKNPMYTENPMTNTGTAWSTTIATFSDIDTTRYRLLFETSGNDIMVSIPFEHDFNNVTNGVTAFRLELDGTAYGNSLGLARIQNFGDQIDEVNHLIHIFENIPAGDHTLDVQWARVSSGTAILEEEPTYIPWVHEY